MRSHPAFLWIYLLLLAPLGVLVILSALLLFGVPPPFVFAPGRVVQSLLHAPTRVGVAATGLFWWAILAVIGLAWDRRRR